MIQTTVAIEKAFYNAIKTDAVTLKKYLCDVIERSGLVEKIKGKYTLTEIYHNILDKYFGPSYD